MRLSHVTVEHPEPPDLDGVQGAMADPWLFDVLCQRCGCVFLSREPWCPECEATEGVEPIDY